MDKATIEQLNRINRDFYRVTAEAFHETRRSAWPGWERLLPYLRAQGEPLTVLDAGCGNGRFGSFLAAHIALVYHGIDNNPTLLARARTALAQLSQVDATFEHRDIVAHPPDSGAYDLVALFGLIHHIPGAARRRQLMRALAGRVAPGGLLVFAAWRFYEYERFRARIVPWAAEMAVEQHDYLLDWRRGEGALRYCHYVDDAEHAQLIEATGLHEIDRFRADGSGGDMNQYSVLKRT